MRLLRIAIPMLLCLPLAACDSGGHFTILGYTTRPNYDDCIKTVYVPTFENKTFRRGMEFDLTRAVITAIEQNTPYKVVDDPSRADTQLTGTILAFSKNILIRNQLNEQRDVETLLTVAVVWKDLRSGEILSQPRAKQLLGPGFAPPDAMAAPSGVPTVDVPTQDTPQPGPAGPPIPKPVIVTSTGYFIPEVGQSLTTAQQQNNNRMAIQIISLMEKAW